MTMHMFYWFGADLGSFIFQGYNVTTIWGLIATCFGLGSLAVVYEAMKLVQMKLRRMTVASIPAEHSVSGENSTLLSRITWQPSTNSSSTYCGSWMRWILEVFHFSMQTTLSYILMLAVMSYNGYFSIALALGGGLGYWIFGPALQQLNMQQFKKKRKNVRCDPECSDAISDATTSTERRPSTVSSNDEELATEVNVEIHA